MHPRKPKYKPGNGPIWQLCNEAFFGVRRLFTDNPSYDAPIAFVEGFVSGYLIADLGAGFYGRSNILEIFNSNPAENKSELEGIIKGAILVEGTILLVSPHKVREFWNEHPTYSRGVLGVMLGATARGIVELLK